MFDECLIKVHPRIAGLNFFIHEFLAQVIGLRGYVAFCASFPKPKIESFVNVEFRLLLMKKVSLKDFFFHNVSFLLT